MSLSQWNWSETGPIRQATPAAGNRSAVNTPGHSVRYLAPREGQQDRNQRNSHQGVSANIGRRVSTVDMGRMSQQSSDGDGRYGKRRNVTETRI